MKFCAGVFLLSLLLSSFASFCQQVRLDALDAFSGSLIKKLREEEGEKAYLVTDKTIYSSGQAIWFRSFLLRSISEKISTRTAHLFVDVVDEKDSVISRSLLNARAQQTGGKLLLPDTTPTGYYWARAYTKAMIKGYAKNAAVIPLYVVNPSNPTATRTGERGKSNASDEQQLVVEMSPEGGSLITGINTTIGFYLHDKAGNPLALPGYIKDSRDSVVAAFATNNFGLAKAEFFPYFNRRYSVVASYRDKEFSFPLPSFNRFAGQLAVLSHANDALKLRTVLEDSIFRNDAVTYLIGLSKDSLCFASIGYGSYETDVPLSKFPKGIATFLLFDETFKLLSERRIYVNESQLTLAANLDKEIYSKRSKAILTTSVLNASGQPVASSLTVSVSDSSALVGEDIAVGNNVFRKAVETGIRNWDLLHLTNLLEQEIDLLLLNGRPFYNDALHQRKNAEDFDDGLFDIKGRLLNAKGEALSNQALTLISKAGNGVFAMDTTDATGRFLFPLSAYMDSTQFIMQINAAKGQSETAKIVFDNYSFPRFQTPVFLKQKFVMPVARRSAYTRRYTDTTFVGDGEGWLKQVSVNTKAKNVNDRSKKMTSSSVLTSEQLLKLGMGNIGIGLLRMPGVQLIEGLVRFYGPNQLPGATGNVEPIVLYDGNQVSLSAGSGGAFSSPVIQYLNSLNPREIEYIEVFKGPEASVYGLRGGNGVIYIHSASEVHQDFVSAEGNAYKFYRQGYAEPAEFPLVTYDEKASKDASFTDARSTLYWAENELVNAKGGAVFPFFTNDIPGHYKVVITGITDRGELIYKTLAFTNK